MARRLRPRRSMFGDRIAPVTSRIRATVIARDGERCGYCWTTTGPWHVDHVLPVRVGGTTDLRNLTVACVDCNRRKGGDVAAFWMRLLARSGAEVPAQRARNLLDLYFDAAV